MSAEHQPNSHYYQLLTGADTSVQLISAEELHQGLNAGQNLRILDVRWRQDRPEGLTEYLNGHIPKAVFVDLDYELSAPAGSPDQGHHPLPALEDFQSTLQRLGINTGDTVVLYDDIKNLSAARAWWLLRHAGLSDIKLLDGSLRAWTSAGYPLQTELNLPEPGDIRLSGWTQPVADRELIIQISSYLTAPGPEQGQPTAPGTASGTVTEAGSTTAAEQSKPAAGEPWLLDVRPANRFDGSADPLAPRPGHIPGAINAPAAANTDAEGRLLSPQLLRQRYQQLGINLNDTVYVYCYSGVHSAHSVLALERAGYHAVLYSAGFSQWSHNPELPVATGT